MKSRGIKFHCQPCRNIKSLHLCRIIVKMLLQILQTSDQHNIIRHWNVYLRASVILQSIQLLIMPHTVSQLHRHSTVKPVRKPFKDRQLFQQRITGNIFHLLRNRFFLHNRQKLRTIISLYNRPISVKSRGRNIINPHLIPPFLPFTPQWRFERLFTT